MQVFKLFFMVLKKNIMTPMIYIIVFVAILIPMSRAGAAEKTFKDASLKIAVFDEDGTAESAALRDFIGRKHEIVKLANDRDKIMQALYFESVDYVLIISDGFSDKLASGDTEGMFSTYHMHETYSTVIASQLLDSYVSSVRGYLAGGMDMAEASAMAADAVLQEAEVTIARSESGGVLSSSSASYFRYLAYILVSVIISALCPVLLKLGKKEFRFRTNCSCIKSSSYTLQLIAGSVAFIAVIWLLMMVVSVVQNGGMFAGNAWFAVLNTLIYTLVCTAIALVICSFEPSDTVVSLVTQIIGLGSSFLCGVFVPMSLLGEGVLAAAKFLPAYWYVKATEMLGGNEKFDAERLAMYMLIELGFAVALMLIALVVNRVKYTGAAIKLPKLAGENAK
ncbi:MAG: ABC transporter permease [Ruminococcus sp.]|nr:ABC transporter permease [Ruminococcus sp.]